VESLLIYAIAGALAVGLSLGIFGSGGSILTVPVLVYLLQHGHKVAIAESLAVVGAVALFSAIPYARGRCVDWRTAVVFGLPGMAGTYLGAWIAAFVPGPVQLFVFAGVMLLAAVQMWRRVGGGDPEAQARSRSILKIGVDGVAVGVLTGFVGVGGGFLIVPALVLLAGLSMRRAVATSLVIIAVKSAAGFWKYLDVLEQVGSVDWGTIGLFTLFGVAGSFAGKALNGRLKHATLQRGFAAFLVVMAGFILVRESANVAPW
jgi:uncharacterized membrane protein YfcA